MERSVEELERDLKLEEEFRDSLLDQLTGLGEVTTILKIQRESGMLLLKWPGHYREYKLRDGYRWTRDFRPAGPDVETRDNWPALSLDDMIALLIEVKVNMARCSHETEVETGEHIPMGSFTDSPTRCTRCGRKVHHD